MVLIRWDPFFEISRAHRLANRRLVGFPRAFASYSDSDEQRALVHSAGHRPWRRQPHRDRQSARR